MTDTFKFRARIPELCGGREAVVAEISRRLHTTHRITQAADASKISDASARAHVDKVLSTVVPDLLGASVAELLDTHLTAVGEEYELFNGECPAEEAAAHVWQKELLRTILESLKGEVESVIGPQVLSAMVYQQCAIDELARAIVSKPIEDFGRAWEALGIGDDVQRSLAIHARQLPPREDAAAEEADVPDDYLTPEVKMSDLPNTETNADGPDIPHSPKDNRAKAQAAKAKRKRAARSAGEPNPISHAAQELLEAILEHTGVSEAGLAEKLGMSRTQMNNYRTGYTVWRPTPEQTRAMRLYVDEVTASIGSAMAELENQFAAEDFG